MLNILVADDSRVMVNLVCKEVGRYLQVGTDCQFFTAAEAWAVDDVLAANRIDIAYLDWNMGVPDKSDGMVALKKIKGDPKTKNIYTVMVTANREREFIRQALAAGVDDYIAKPFVDLEGTKKFKEVLDDALVHVRFKEIA